MRTIVQQAFMIGKHFKGKAFYPILNYALGKSEAQLIETNLVHTQPTDLAQEFQCFNSLNRNVKRPMYHASLSLPLGEQLENARWKQVAQEFLTQMGFNHNAFVIVRHSDRPHDHIHIIASRIRFDGSCVSDSWNHYQLQAVTRQLEQMFELTPVPASWERQQNSVTQCQKQSICLPQKKQIEL